MTICLPYADPSFPWWKRISIHLFNWVAWIVPAVADSTANDMGREAQGIIAGITSLGLLIFLAVPLVSYFVLKGDGWHCFWFGIGSYLVVGLIYHINEEGGPYS